MSAESPKQKEKAIEGETEPEAILVAEVVDESDQTKKKSSASGADLARELPQPPGPAQPKGRSLLTTETGEDVQFLEDESDEDGEIDLIANHREKEKQKPRMSFSFRFFGGSSKNKQKVHKNKAARPGSMFAFLMPKPANSTYNNMKGGKGKVESEDSRIDSVAWRRKESIEMTKSLKMDMDIYQYLKERSPSFEEEEKIDIEEPSKSLIPPPKVKRKGKKAKGGTTSNLLVGGDVREATKAPHLEMQRRKRKGFFGRFKLFGRSKEPGKKPGFASRMLSRMSFRPTSYTETTADEMRQLLEASETKENKDQELYRKDSDDSNASDETDLSADIDIDSTLLVKDGETNTPKAAVAEEEDPGRASKIFEEDEDKPKTKAAVLKSEMSKSSDELVVVKKLQTSSKSTEAYLEDDA